MHLSNTEWKVMNALWRMDTATVRDVHEQLHGETQWAYTTVKTMLMRLADKNVVTVTRRGNVSQFRAVLSREDARRSALRALADRAFDGAFTPLIQFLMVEESVSEEELARIRSLLEAEDADTDVSPEGGLDDNDGRN